MRQQDAPAGDRERLPVGQGPLRLLCLVVAVDDDHRRDHAQLVEHPQFADIPGVEQEVDAAQHLEERRWQRERSAGKKRSRGVVIVIDLLRIVVPAR